GANIDRLFTERSMVLQAWGAYGVLWPVVHQWLGVSPDLGRGRLTVVPQLPPDQRTGSVKRVRLGEQVSVDVTARRQGDSYLTEVRRRGDVRLTIGAVVPRGAEIRSIRLNGKRVEAHLVRTARGLEVQVPAGRGSGVSELRVTVR
ncbi:MAG TPA: glycogen debranching protein, partial [Propionibacteriaceae bacterium]|nr:glycogen debranching protein [Propionibacteriaceae bacterium]